MGSGLSAVALLAKNGQKRWEAEDGWWLVRILISPVLNNLQKGRVPRRFLTGTS